MNIRWAYWKTVGLRCVKVISAFMILIVVLELYCRTSPGFPKYIRQIIYKSGYTYTSILQQQLEPSKETIEERSRRDLQTLEHFCRHFNMTKEKISPYTLKHIHVDTERRVLYCYVPKVACTSWKRIFIKLTRPSLLEKDVNKIPRGVLHQDRIIPKLSHQRFAIKRDEILRTYKKFFFVRNPYTRVLSAFKDKFQSTESSDPTYSFPKTIGVTIEEKYRGASSNGTTVTFPEFIRYISEPNGDEMQRNEHWRSVHELCNPCSIQYDFMGRYETLVDDSNYVLDWIGARDVIDKFPDPDRPLHVKGFDHRYYDQLTSMEKRDFVKMFIEDFVPFNYSIFDV